MVTTIEERTWNIEMEAVCLDADRMSSQGREFEEKLSRRVIGQACAVCSMSNIYQVFLAGLNSPDRPVGTLLLLGPTGSGKTHLVEAAAETLFGTSGAVIKIDCAEYQHSHEIAKLTGSPPGYLGHRETNPLLTQESLDCCHTENTKLSFVLFDEIEKASDALWQLLLGILDKATLTLGDNRRVDFSRSLIVMTSNLGAREMSGLVSGGMGFTAAKAARPPCDDIDQKIHRTAIEAARRKFSPEFMNRIDKIEVFRSLEAEQLSQILDLELQAVQNRVRDSEGASFIFECSDRVRQKLLEEGTDSRYGARHLKRAIERRLVYPLANLLSTGQIELGDFVHIDLGPETDKLVFSRYRDAGSARDDARLKARPEARRAKPSRSLLSIGGFYNMA
jgi:ATP-dependent Clp protease ATP-binding subunit ClpB